MSSVAVCRSRTHFKLEATCHFLLVVTREFHSGCSLPRTWRNAPEVKLFDPSVAMALGSCVLGVAFTCVYPCCHSSVFHPLFADESLIIVSQHALPTELSVFTRVQTDFLV